MGKIPCVSGGIQRRGFALPTVLIASVVLLTMLAVAVGAVNTARVALQGQYYNQLAKEAAESGLQMARACIDDGYLTWDEPLRPGGDCYGASQSCLGDECYIVNTPTARTTFSVPTPDISGDISSIKAEGSVERIRESTGAVWKSYKSSLAMQDTVSDINPGDEVLWKKLAVGGPHTCAISTEDEVYCWGWGQNGELGDGTSTHRDTPVKISQGAIPDGVIPVDLKSGRDHTCMLGSNNRTYCWGRNDYGQLGNNTTTNASAPVATSMPSGVTFTSLGNMVAHTTCAVGSNNRAYCWGLNDYQQVGNNSGTTNRLIPTLVVQGAMPAGLAVSEVASSTFHSCAVATSNSRTYCWGHGNAEGRLGNNGTTASATPVLTTRGALPDTTAIMSTISPGAYNTCAIGVNAQVYCWGRNTANQLGDGTVVHKLQAVALSRGAMPVDRTVVSLGTGNDHSCASASNGRAYCWGVGTSGQLGNNTASNASTPVLVNNTNLPANTSFDEMGSGTAHSCTIATNQKIYCWGSNAEGRLGVGTSITTSTIPVSVATVYKKPAVPRTVFKQISTSNNHACGIASNNQAYCWGAGTGGQLGNGATTVQSTPVAVSQGAIPNGVTLRSVSAGVSHSCAVALNNQAYCWGLGTSGQLGDGANANQSTPVAVSQGAIPNGVTLRSISAGLNYTCALASNNQAYCWGAGSNSQLGNGTAANQSTPVAVSQGAIPNGVTLRSIAAGEYHACAIASNSRAYCWGLGSNGRIGDGDNATRTTPVAVSQGAIPNGVTLRSISTNASHTCAIASNDQAYCWGLGVSGQLGDGDNATRTTPVAVSQGAIPNGVTLRSVAAGTSASCALASNSQAYCWGAGSQLGDGVNANQSSPVAVSQGAIPAGVTLRSVSASCAFASNSQVYCWGSGSGGRLGNGATTDQTSPVAIAQGTIPSNVVLSSIGTGTAHSCALSANGQAYCWGAGSTGRLGNDDTANRTTPVAVSQGAIPSGAILRTFAISASHNCVIASDSQTYCWGAGVNSQLGNGATANQTTPVAVSQGAIPAGVTLRSISGGSAHVCAIASNSQAYCWGTGGGRQLGDGGTASQSTPVAVSQGAIPAGVTLRSISAGASHTCAIASNNQAYCWGTASSGQLGNGATTVQPTPVAVSQGAIPAGVTLRSISTNASHTCALASNNQAYCWGLGTSGQLGNGATANQTTPVAVSQGAIPAGVTLRSISAGGAYTCATASNNRVYCWGAGTSSQLGDGGITNQTTPVAVVQGAIPSGEVLRSIATANAHTCVLGSTGRSYCWGTGTSGQLGNGIAIHQPTPVATDYISGTAYLPDYLLVGPRRFF